MTTVTQKTERIYEEILKTEDRFTKLEEQQNLLSDCIEKASATILAEIREAVEQLKKCNCKIEIHEAIQSLRDRELVVTHASTSNENPLT